MDCMQCCFYFIFFPYMYIYKYLELVVVTNKKLQSKMRLEVRDQLIIHVHLLNLVMHTLVFNSKQMIASTEPHSLKWHHAFLRRDTKGFKILSSTNKCQLAQLTHWGRENGRHFPDDIFKCIFLNENVRIASNISLNCVLYGPIDYKSALVQIMAWRRAGDKPLSEPMMTAWLYPICYPHMNPLMIINTLIESVKTTSI